MNRVRILTKQTTVANFEPNDLYEDISRDWQYKARKLQARRWRQLKHPVRAGH